MIELTSTLIIDDTSKNNEQKSENMLVTGETEC